MTFVAQVMKFSKFTRITDAYSWRTGILGRPGDVTKLERKIAGGSEPALIREIHDEKGQKLAGA